MGEPQKDRVAKNESLFRDVNERVREIDQRQAAPSSGTEALSDFLCECGNADCTETVAMSLAEYDRLRASPLQFVVLPGHEAADVERVVERTDRFVIVEKLPGERRVALDSDTRS